VAPIHPADRVWGTTAYQASLQRPAQVTQSQDTSGHRSESNRCGVATTIPAEALTSQLSWETLLGAVALAAVLLLVSRGFWRPGLAALLRNGGVTE